MKYKVLHILSITTLVGLMVMGFVGGLSGSLAWLAYSNRTSVAFVGQMLRSTSGLQMSLDDHVWSETISNDNYESTTFNNNYDIQLVNEDDESRIEDIYKITFDDGSVVEEIVPLGSGEPTVEKKDGKYVVNRKKTDISLEFGTKLVPVTAGSMGKNGSLKTLYDQPRYQDFELSTWERASASSYLKYRLAFRDKDVNEEEDIYLAKYVYLAYISIEDVDENNDLSSAIRIHIQNSDKQSWLFAKPTDEDHMNDDIEISTVGKLDINHDGMNDWDFLDDDDNGIYEWHNKTERYYGGESRISKPDGSEIQTAMSIYDYSEDSILVDDSNEYSVNHLGSTKSLIKTRDDGEPVYLYITIWIEGWNPLDYSDYVQEVNYVDTTLVGEDNTSDSSLNIYQANFSNGQTYVYPNNEVIEPNIINGTYHFNGKDSTISDKVGTSWSASEYIAREFKIIMRFVVPGDEE